MKIKKSASEVSVPIWGLFNLTWRNTMLLKNATAYVSVPIWGLFNLTVKKKRGKNIMELYEVSVPIWGLFNLTFKSLPSV